LAYSRETDSVQAAGEAWFRSDLQGEDLLGAAWAYADSLWNSSYEVDRRTQLLKQATQYLGRPVLSLVDFESVPNASTTPAPTFRTTRNLTRTLADTALSQFAKTETRTQFLTDGGTDAEQDQAELRTDASNALLQQTGTEQELRKAALHAVVFDLGSVKFVKGPRGPEAEHVPAWENMFDQVDGRRARTIRVQRFTADKDSLIDNFAKVEPGDDSETIARKRNLSDDIRTSSSAGLQASDRTMSDQHVIGYELWRLPVGEEPGRHVVVTDSALLFDEEWDAESFPFTDFGWSDDPLGMYPVSIAFINSANQDELDGVGRRISQILRQCAIPQYIEQGAVAGNTAATQLRVGEDAIGDIVQVPPGKTLTRQPAGPVVGAELFQHEDRVWQRGYEMTGINPQSAQGTRPNGLNSAPAQREWNEIRQDRLSLVALQYQQAHVDAAKQLLQLVAEMPEYEITIKDANGRWLRKVKVDDLNLQGSDYVIQAFPISALPSTPTGKLAAAADLLQMQAITREEFLEIIQLPDLKGVLNIKDASRKATKKIVGKMLAERQPYPVSERMDLDYALEYATAQWLNGIVDDMDDERMGLLNDWINECVALKQKRDAAAAPAAPVAPGLAGTSIAPMTPSPLAAPVSAQQFGATLAGPA
jgi:hypothetical protein